MTTNRLRFVETDPPQNAEELIESKKRLRSYMKARRGENENRDVKECLLVDNVFSALKGKGMGTGTDKRAFVYLSFSSEAPTDKLIESLIAQGWRVYCPRLENKKMVAVEYGEELALSAFGIREPLGEAYEGDMDVAIVPTLAVDEQGRRLGYGGGYYDRYLPKTRAYLAGVCHDAALHDSLPAQAHDVKMDAVITPSGLILPHNRTRNADV